LVVDNRRGHTQHHVAYSTILSMHLTITGDCIPQIL
jgi:hypothetical protein